VSLEDGGAVMRLEDAQRAFDKRNQVSYYNLQIKDARRTDAIKAEIEARWPDLAPLAQGMPPNRTRR